MKRLVFCFAFFLFLYNFSTANAYGVNTHAYLAHETLDFYNQHVSQNVIPQELGNFLIDGARREDDAPRWMNHFYDPVNDVGLHDALIGTWEASKDWANDSASQNNLKYKVPAVIASILTAVEQGEISEIFSETDFTWNKAIRYWVSGEKEKAMFTLGHVIHLIEDASVPDHTRNDPHTAGSPYESWTAQFNLQNKDTGLSARLVGKNPITLNNLGFYFDGLAGYSNNGFYSKDTIGIQSGYELPQPDYFSDCGDYICGIKDDDSGNYKIFIKKRGLLNNIYSSSGEVSIFFEKSGGDVVMNDYWSRLSTKAVQYGAGVIDLFFKEAEAAKSDPNFFREEPKSFVASALDVVHNFTSAVGGAFQRAVSAAADAMGNLFGGAPIPPSENVNTSAFSPPANSPASVPPVLSEVPAMGGLSPEVEESLAGVDEAARLREIQSQLDDIADLVDDLTYRVAAVTGHPAVGGVLNIVSPTQTSLLSPQVAQDTSAVLLTATVSGGSGGGSGGSGGVAQSSRTFPKILISEIQLSSASSTRDEFVELYNPNGSAVVLTDWYVQKKTASGTSFSTFAPASLFAGKTIPAHSYFLIAHPSSTFAADVFTSYGITDNNSLVLKNPDGSIVDKIGWGSANDCEGACAPNPADSQSIQRKSLNGAFLDTDSNVNDWQLESCPSPKARSGNCSASPANTAPSAIFTVSPLPPLVNQTVTFDASSSTDADGTIVLYRWDFGDGQNTSSTQAISTHSYLASGNYTVRLVVFDDNNSSSTISSILPVASSTSSNQTPNASFVYTPENPKVGDIITFNAASSTDDGAIVSYEWNFGDNTTSTILIATTTHTYSQVGDYQINLIVFDNQSASSTATSTIISVASSTSQLSESNHLVISEIQVKGDAADNEFIEFYNPTSNAVPLSGYSIQYLSGTATSTEKIQKKNFTATSSIPAKGFYLIVNSNATSSLKNKADMTYSSFALSGNSNGATIFLVSTTTSISSINDSTIVDSLSYGNPQLVVSAATSTVPDSNKSLERKTFSGGQCVAASGSGEFLSNGCDTDSATDFEIRAVPNPQNTQSFPEPRAAPAAPVALDASSSIAAYNSSSLTVSFVWQPSADFTGTTSTVRYELYDVSDAASSTFLASTTSTAFSYRVNEVGRNFTYALNSLDRDGLSSVTTTITIAVPSFLDNLYFYRDPRASSTSYLIDLYYPRYPFVLQLWSSGDAWRMVVFNLNRDAPAEEYLMIGERSSIDPALLAQMVVVQFKNCAGTPNQRDTFLVFPDTAAQCQYAGPLSGDLSFQELEDPHVLFTLASSTADVAFTSSTDYLTAAFYDFWPYNVPRTFRLVAADRMKYYFRDVPPSHAAPVLNGSTTVDFDEPNSRLVVRWGAATDLDTLDNTIAYEINFSPGGTLDETQWQSASPQPRAQVDDLPPISYNYPRTVSPGDAFAIGVRAKDEFRNVSNVATTSWAYPPTAPPINAAVSQLDDSVSAANVGSNPTQTLGNLSGTFTDMTVHFVSQGSLITKKMIVREYDTMPMSSNMAGYTTQWWPISDNYIRDGTTATFLASEYSTPIIFNPSKFYAFIFYGLDRNFKGSGSDVINGKFYWRMSGPDEDSNVKDIYFVLNGAD